jgi:hypothetical protein
MNNRAQAMTAAPDITSKSSTMFGALYDGLQENKAAKRPTRITKSRPVMGMLKTTDV